MMSGTTVVKNNASVPGSPQQQNNIRPAHSLRRARSIPSLSSVALYGVEHRNSDEVKQQKTSMSSPSSRSASPAASGHGPRQKSDSMTPQQVNSVMKSVSETESKASHCSFNNISSEYKACVENIISSIKKELSDKTVNVEIKLDIPREDGLSLKVKDQSKQKITINAVVGAEKIGINLEYVINLALKHIIADTSLYLSFYPIGVNDKYVFHHYENKLFRLMDYVSNNAIKSASHNKKNTQEDALNQAPFKKYVFNKFEHISNTNAFTKDKKNSNRFINATVVFPKCVTPLYEIPKSNGHEQNNSYDDEDSNYNTIAAYLEQGVKELKIYNVRYESNAMRTAEELDKLYQQALSDREKMLNKVFERLLSDYKKKFEEESKAGTVSEARLNRLINIINVINETIEKKHHLLSEKDWVSTEKYKQACQDLIDAIFKVDGKMNGFLGSLKKDILEFCTRKVRQSLEKLHVSELLKLSTNVNASGWENSNNLISGRLTVVAGSVKGSANGALSSAASANDRDTDPVNQFFRQATKDYSPEQMGSFFAGLCKGMYKGIQHTAETTTNNPVIPVAVSVLGK